MKENPSWLTPKQASLLIGYTARHIQNMITSGKLTATKEDGKYYIEKSEFYRLFPKAKLKEEEGSISLKIEEKKRLALENELLKQMASQNEKEIEFLRKQIEFISNEKTKMLDTITSGMRFLEHKGVPNKPQKKRFFKWLKKK